MDEHFVADYFVVAGLPDQPEPVDEDYCEGLNPNSKNLEPITDITVIFPSLGEEVPKGFLCVERTPAGYPANLNSGSIRSPEVFLCFRRGTDKPPLVDVGVMYEGKERLLPDAEVVMSTPEGRPANVNNTNARILLTYRRAQETMPCNELVVTDICVIITNKGERPPHAFCLIQKNLNKGTIMGCDVFLCYKKSMNRPPLLSYKADVLLRYPLIDRRGFPFPDSVAMFCLPMCATIECWPVKSSQPRPVFSTFVLTVADATEKIYGSAVTFYEKYPEEKLSEEQKTELGILLPGIRADKSIHVNKSICLLSHYPFFDSFRSFLYHLVKMCMTGSHEVPIERYISHLLEEVPFPSPQRPHILLQLSATQNLLLSHPHDSPRPRSGASFRHLLSNLGPENCLLVLLLVLTEQKLLIHSLRPDVLTAVSEAVSVLIFPFHWQCPYIPLCPLGLCAVIQAPVPFLIGVDSRFFDLYEPPADVTCIDLDTSAITISEDRRQLLSVKMLPKKAARLLKHTLEDLQTKLGKLRPNRRGGDSLDPIEIDLQMKKRERMLDLEIQEAFLRFMTGIMKGYRSYLLPITKAPTVGATDASSLFDFAGFQRSREKTYHKFYQMMLRTQMFIRFIEERSFVSDMDTGLAFFDECVDKVEQDESDGLRLMDINEGGQSERTVFVMPPEAVGLEPGTLYEYNSVFKLNEILFGSVRHLQKNHLNKILNVEYASPGSPVAKRTKQEIKSAKKNARLYSEQPMQWAKCLLSTCYSLWFIHLPSYLSMATSKHMALCLAYDMLVRMAKNRLLPADEVCYRVVMQLCGLYSQPVTAVKVLFEMKRCGMTPNAITYGFYNKAVLEAKWPSNVSNSSQLMWHKLRNVIYGVAQFRSAVKGNRRLSLSATDEVDHISTGSGGSLEFQSQKAHTPTSAAPGLLLPQNATLNQDPTNATARDSSSSDVGYGSMHEQDNQNVEQRKEASENSRQIISGTKFWGKMGQSLDSWVKSGVTSLANVAALAADSNYYNPAGLMFSSYTGEYSNCVNDCETDIYEDEDEGDVPRQIEKGKSHRKLDFTEEQKDVESENTMRLLRSVSFGNDTQIMSKLKELKEEMTNKAKKGMKKDKRCASEESNGSLENKVNRFYEGTENNTREASVEKNYVNSREMTPLDEEDVANFHGEMIPHSPSVPVNEQNNSYGSNLSTAGSSTPNNLNSPARTPVTQNDPLGALNTNQNQMSLPNSLSTLSQQPQNSKRDSPKRMSSHEGRIGTSLSNLPYETETVESKHNGGFDLSGSGAVSSKSFHRSTTLPNYASTLGGTLTGDNDSKNGKLISAAGNSSGGNINTTSGLSVLGSSLKSFSRYSPARLSFKKAGSHLLESTIGNKKAEALMEGFNQFKSQAAVTAKKKLDEFKEAINSNSPANRNGPFGRLPDELSDTTEDSECSEPVVDQWASVSESYLDQLLTTTIVDSTRESFASGEMTSHHETPLTSSTQSLDQIAKTLAFAGAIMNKKEPQYPVAIEISMTTCSLCHNCSSLLFDEEIMAGWTAEDSNLNTRCPHCKKWEVPFLEVRVKDFRHAPVSSSGFGNSLGSVPSLENIQGSSNIPRRMSLNPSLLTNSNNALNVQNQIRKLSLNPEAVGGRTDQTFTDSEGNNRGPFNTSELESIANCVNAESPTEDPLGVVNSKVNPNVTVTTTNEPTESENPDVLEPIVAAEGLEAEPIIVPYLSPLVLRKELENVLEHEGDTCLVQAQFVDEHPIIYWNLVWFFNRSNLTSHLKGLTLHAVSTKPLRPQILKSDEVDSGAPKDNLEEIFHDHVIHPSWAQADHRNVFIRCKWDNPKYYEQFGTPLYVQWLEIQKQQMEASRLEKEIKSDDSQKDNEVDGSTQVQPPAQPTKSDSERLIFDILRCVPRGEMTLVCPKLLHYYHKQNGSRHFPAYRDIFFLSLINGAKDAIDVYGFGFDRDYRNCYSRMRNSDEFETMDLGDTPPQDSALFCRKIFRDLQLL